MATTERSAAVEIRRTLTAPLKRVYEAWTDPKALTRWFGPSDDYTVVVHQLEVRAGGAYRIEMRHAGGAVHVVTGRYTELQPPNRLAFTWRWDDRPEMPDSLVTVDLATRQGGTELTLVHARLATDEDRANHEKGWQGCFERLARLV